MECPICGQPVDRADDGVVYAEHVVGKNIQTSGEATPIMEGGFLHPECFAGTTEWSQTTPPDDSSD
jgi:hypothetical protein